MSVRMTPHMGKNINNLSSLSFSIEGGYVIKIATPWGVAYSYCRFDPLLVLLRRMLIAQVGFHGSHGG